MIVMPADHVIEPVEAFRTTVRAAVSVIDDDPSDAGHLRHQARLTPRPATATSSAGRSWRLAKASRSIASSSSARSPTAPRPSGSWPPATSPGTPGSSSGAARTILDELRAHRPQLADGLEPILRAIGTPEEAETLARHFPAARAGPDRQGRHGARAQRPRARGAVSTGAMSATGVPWPASWNATPPATPFRATSSLATRPDSIMISDDGGLVADARRRRPGRRPFGQGDAGRQERPARQAQGPGRRIGRGRVRGASLINRPCALGSDTGSIWLKIRALFIIPAGAVSESRAQ